MSNAKQNLHLAAAAILFCAAMVLAVVLQLKNDEQKQKPPAPTQDDVGVCVISIDFDRRPVLLWSNRRAQPGEDGTVTISKAVEGDSEQ